MTRAALISVLVAVSAAWAADDRNWKYTDHETIRRSFDVSASSEPKRLLVDNVTGAVHVTGYSGKEIQVTVERSTRAWSNSALQAAKQEVKLDMDQQGNFVRLYADGPFRGNGGTNYRGDDYYGYHVAFDYEIQTPPGVELVLKTINGGVAVKKTTGHFEINGINGGIDVSQITGAGLIHTINGPVNVTFARNPTEECQFYTLNGKLEVYFQPGLNANLAFKTFNGSVYTDFDVSALPAQPVAGEEHNGRFVFRSIRNRMAARVGTGGPELSFEAFNGTIRLHDKGF